MQALQIGEWSADPATNELRRTGDRLRLEPKAMEVLVVLARHAGEVVSREQLFAAVWPGVVVGDEALTQSIIKLRRALGDNPRAPSYIETISKRGYRLVAPVGGPAVRTRRPLALAAAVLVAIAAGAVAVHALVRPPATPRSGAASVGPADEVRTAPITMTVLPFETLGPAHDREYLARGIGSDLMTDLSRISGLRVISSASGARYVVSGSVQREGATLRINVRLSDSRTGEQLWAQRFERPYGELFALQNEIDRVLLEQLPARITDAERQRLAQRYTGSLEAYDDFLRAQALFLVRRPEENLRARAMYEKALALDPKFARAYAGLAMTYAMEYRYQRSSGSTAVLARALQLAESARQIDPGIPEVYWALGFVHTQSRRYDEAIASLEKAIQLNPSYADAYALMGGIYTYIGQPAKSVPLLRTALRLNPDGGYLYYLLLGRAYLFEDDLEQALINLREANARNPDNIETRVFLTAALVASGDRSGAEWQADQIRVREEGFAVRNWLKTYPLASAPQRKRLLQLLAQAGL
ncbi:MAG TPA: winged helix-turn-helix domain-containing protein [Burkholderiales bacterium]|nr:winged helix-turn-helix domain-containing protein [Burkholderiales bacterium]